MERRMEIIGDEIVVEGQVVGILKPGLGATFRDNVVTTLRGLTVSDYWNTGANVLIEELKDDAEDYKAGVNKLVTWCRSQLAKGRASRRDLVAKANARVNELKERIRQLESATPNQTLMTVQVDGSTLHKEMEQWSAAYSVLKAERDELEGRCDQWAAAYNALAEQLAEMTMQAQTLHVERDEARAWAESAVKQAWEQGVEVGKQAQGNPYGDPVGTRYFVHPESCCFLKTYDGSSPGLECDELDAQRYYLSGGQ